MLRAIWKEWMDTFWWYYPYPYTFRVSLPKSDRTFWKYRILPSNPITRTLKHYMLSSILLQYWDTIWGYYMISTVVDITSSKSQTWLLLLIMITMMMMMMMMVMMMMMMVFLTYVQLVKSTILGWIRSWCTWSFNVHHVNGDSYCWCFIRWMDDLQAMCVTSILKGKIICVDYALHCPCVCNHGETSYNKQIISFKT